MAKVTLTDQLGAMKCVDELRHAQIAVDEHLDLGTRRAEVAKQVTNYYTQNGITVQADVVEQGVRAYFDRRLTFEVPAISRLENWLSKMYITRSQWGQAAAETGRSFAGLAIVLGVVGIIATWVYFDYQRYVNRGVTSQISTVMTRVDQAKEELSRARMKVNEVAQEMSNFPDLRTATFIAPLDAELKNVTELLRPLQHIDSPVTDDNRTGMQSTVTVTSQVLDQVDVRQAKVNAMLTSATELLRLRQRFAEWTDSEPYREMERLAPPIKSRTASIKLAFANADATNIGAIDKAVDLLIKSIANGPTLRETGRKLDALSSRFAAMHLDAADTDAITPLIAAAREAIGQGDVSAAVERVDHLTKLAEFAATPLSLNIVDKAGVKSGVERNYNPTSGKSWYVIVEALDKAGNVVPAPVRPSEKGGPVQFKPYFGVRISHELYDAMKAEKKATGHPPRTIMGTKPANSMNMAYQNTYSNNPEVIVEW